MLTDEDIKKLIEVFTTREETKEMVAKLTTKEDFNNLQISVDAYAVLHHSVRCWSKVFHKKVLTRF